MMRYEGFSPQERQDEILDKISKYGIESLNIDEKEFMDSWSEGGEEEAHKKMNYHENEIVFEDDSGLFKFEFQELEDYGNEKHLIGVIYVPDLVWEDGLTIEGRLEGRIVDYGEGKTSPDFYAFVKDPKTGQEVQYDIFEFCNGIEYELDSFIDYVISEIENNEF
jgi:hypothetical protein